MSDWTRLEDEAAKRISDVMREMVRRRWDKATPADKAEAVKRMAAGKRKAKKRGKK
jgi:hypothetical protein